MPDASETARVGSSATAATSTWTVAVVVATSSPSVDIATTVNVKSTSEFAGGVMVRFSRSPAVKVQVPSPLSVPADSSAPSGTPSTTMDRVSEASVTRAEISSSMAASSAPAASATSNVGASAPASPISTGCPSTVMANSSKLETVKPRLSKTNSEASPCPRKS